MELERYLPENYRHLWSTRYKYKTWLEVELAHLKAREKFRLVPTGTYERLNQTRKEASLFYFGYEEAKRHVDYVQQEQVTTKHEMTAFLKFCRGTLGSEAELLHQGLTSSDVQDTAQALILIHVLQCLLVDLDQVCGKFSILSKQFASTLCLGRTHGQDAELVTFGYVLLRHFNELHRCRLRLETVEENVSFGKLSGPVGAYHHTTLEVEAEALLELELNVAQGVGANQVVPRDFYTDVVYAVAQTAAALESFATNVRLWSQSGCSEVTENFEENQTGSSAMPHKRNPLISEQLCGLARLVRAQLQPTFETQNLWHERDLTNSSVERVTLPLATSVLGHMLGRTHELLNTLHVNENRMRANVAFTRGTWASEGVLIGLQKQGLSYDEAYSKVREGVVKVGYGDGYPDAFKNWVCLPCNVVSKLFDLGSYSDRCAALVNASKLHRLYNN